MLHAGLRSFSLFQFDVKLFKLGFRAAKLRDRLIIVHLLDLVVLELLLVELLLIYVLRSTVMLYLQLSD